MTSSLWPYWPLLAGVFFVFNVTILLCALLAAFSSISRTMSRTRTLWDESERALHRLNTLLDDLESGRDRRNG